MSSSTTIDIHRHWVPNAYQEARQSSPSGSPSIGSDCASEAEAGAPELDDSTSVVLSVPWPAATASADPQTCRRLARAINTQSASVCKDPSGRYAYFASLPPFTDIVGTVAELKHSLDEGDAAGVSAFSSYGKKNLYLGHPDFAGIWKQLNQREAVVFLHPSPPSHQYGAAVEHEDMPRETAKVAMDLMRTKTLANNPNVKVILAYGGGTLATEILEQPSAELAAQARAFYFDITGLSDGDRIRAVLDLAPLDRLLYGTDLPHGAPDTASVALRAVQARHGDAGVDAVLRRNARVLFPAFG